MSRLSQLLSNLTSVGAEQPQLWLAVLLGALVLALVSGLLLRRNRRGGQQPSAAWSVQAGGVPAAAREFSLPPSAPLVAPGDSQVAAIDSTAPIDDPAQDASSPNAPAGDADAASPAAQPIAWWHEEDDATGDTWWAREDTASTDTPTVPSVYAPLAALDDGEDSEDPDPPVALEEAPRSADTLTSDHISRS